MKIQNDRVATKAYQLEDERLWTEIFIVIFFVMSMTIYNNPVC